MKKLFALIIAAAVTTSVSAAVYGDETNSVSTSTNGTEMTVVCKGNVSSILNEGESYKFTDPANTPVYKYIDGAYTQIVKDEVWSASTEYYEKNGETYSVISLADMKQKYGSWYQYYVVSASETKGVWETIAADCTSNGITVLKLTTDGTNNAKIDNSVTEALLACTTITTLDLSDVTIDEITATNQSDGSVYPTFATGAGWNKTNTTLTTLYTPQVVGSNTVIAENTFSELNGLVNLYISDGPTEIAHNFFANNSNTVFSSVTFPKTVTKINADNSVSNVFGNGSSNLTSVTFEGYDDYVFVTDAATAKTSLAAGSREPALVLSPYTFAGLTKLSSVTFERGLKTIEDRAFNGCALLESISLPDGLETIGSYAFAQCSLNSIDFGNTLKTVNDHAFYNPSNGTDEGVNYIHDVKFPATIEYIGELAFGLNRITDVYFYGYDAPEVVPGAFDSATTFGNDGNTPANASQTVNIDGVDVKGMSRLNFLNGSSMPFGMLHLRSDLTSEQRANYTTSL